MNVLIISTNRNRYPMPVMPLGACLVTEATATAGHQVRLIDLMFAKNPSKLVASAIRELNPDVIGLSIRNIDNNDMENPVFYLRELPPLLELIGNLTNAPVVLGGASVSVMPKELLNFTGAACAVCGDGDLIFPKLIENLAEGFLPKDLPGIAWLEGKNFRINQPEAEDYPRSCPVPDFKRWLDVGAYKRHLASAPLQTKLGCKFNCVYCTYHKIEGNKYRILNPESAVKAVEKLNSLGFQDIEIVDNVFNSPYDHALAFCEGVSGLRKNIRLHSLEINPLSLDDKLLGAMEKAGFAGIGLTVESASPPVLEGLKKGFTVEKVYQAADLISRHNLPCLWIFLLGGPGETQETVRETLDFARHAVNPKDVVFFNIGLRIYPGTELEKIARRQGVLDISPEEMLKPFFYISPEVEVEWIRKTIKKAMTRNLNFIDGNSINLPLIPAFNYLGNALGIKPPLWKHSKIIRRGMRMVGMEN